jgi:energy-converting hydrogenase Eha subunit C
MTIVGRQRTRLTVDILTIAAWVVLGLIVAPIIGLALSPLPAVIVFAVMLAGIFVYVLRFGHFDVAFTTTLSWPITWSLLALFFAFCLHQLVLYQ